MFHIRRYRAIKGVSYVFTCNTFRRGLEGELAARSLYARRSAIAEALVRHDPIGAGLRWRNLTPRVTYSVPGNSTF